MIDLRITDAAPELLAACRAVVNNWEHGDLAAAVRQCAAVIEKIDGGEPKESWPNRLARLKREAAAEGGAK